MKYLNFHNVVFLIFNNIETFQNIILIDKLEGNQNATINNINNDLDYIYKCIDYYEKNPRIKINEDNNGCSKCIIT